MENVEVVFEDGEVIVAEGDDTREMYIIQEGQVSVEKTAGNTVLHLGTLGRGDSFGEMSLLQNMPRSATVRSVGRTRLMVLHTGGFLLYIRRDPTFAFELINQLCSRLRRVDESLVAVIGKLGLSAEQVKELLSEIEIGVFDKAIVKRMREELEKGS